MSTIDTIMSVFFTIFAVSGTVVLIAILLDSEYAMMIFGSIFGLSILALVVTVAIGVFTAPSLEDRCRDAGGSYVDTNTRVCYDSDKQIINLNLKPL